ncbi:hypothetical protein TgHK011_007887 [Trichoderma gracile]|nr:hypothetical protein TgHK011_007887 [Trichoderma gracile]
MQVLAGLCECNRQNKRREHDLEGAALSPQNLEASVSSSAPALFSALIPPARHPLRRATVGTGTTYLP